MSGIGHAFTWTKSKESDGFYFCSESPDSSLSIEKAAQRKIYNEAELYVTIDFVRLVKRVSKEGTPDTLLKRMRGSGEKIGPSSCAR